MATAREQLHEIVERMSEDEASAALERLALTADDPLLRAFVAAPDEDEEISDEEEQAVAQSRQDLANGDTISHDELRRELG